jgi:hypothetical protein
MKQIKTNKQKQKQKKAKTKKKQKLNQTNKKGGAFNEVKIPYSSDVLSEKICAVHATNFFPKGMKIISGGIVEGISNETTSRGRIHLALGTMVMPHGHGRDSVDYDNDWEDRKYAIIVSLKNLVKQLLNLNCYDTFILGDYSIPEGSIIILPEGEEHISTIPQTIKVVTYTSGTPIRAKIDKTITVNNYWNI